MCRTASPLQAHEWIFRSRLRAARSCAGKRRCRAVATPDRPGFHREREFGGVFLRVWSLLPEVLLLCPSLMARRMRSRDRVPLCREGHGGEPCAKGRVRTCPEKPKRYFVRCTLGGVGVP